MGTTVVVGRVVVGTVAVGTVLVTGIEVDGREVVVGADLVPDALLVLLPPHAVRPTLKQATRTQSLIADGFIRLAGTDHNGPPKRAPLIPGSSNRSIPNTAAPAATTALPAPSSISVMRTMTR